VTSTPAPRAHAHDGLILAIACVAQFMVVLDVSIVNVALPSIQRDLHMTGSGSLWVVNAYTLTFAGFLLLGGRAADLLGRRAVFLAGLAIFTLASIGAGLAQSETQLIVARAIQGFGGAILSPATLTIIVTTFSGAALPKAIGAWSAVAGAGGAFGSVLGGILVGELSWRWVFFINVPIGILGAIAAVAYLHELRNREAQHRLDIFGAGLVTVGLFSLVYGIINTQKVVNGHPLGWGATSTLEWMLFGGVLLVGFVFWELKVATNPLVPFRVFKSRSLTIADLVMFLIGGAFFSMWYFLTFYLQEVHGYDALKAGFAFLPMAVAIIIGAQLSSRLVTKVGVRSLVFVGTVLATLGFLWLALLSPTSPYLFHVIPAAITCALAMGLLFTPLATAATADIDRREAGLASALLNTARQVGGSLGLAVLATVATSVTTAALLHAPSPGESHQAHYFHAVTRGYDVAFAISALFTAAAFALAWLIPTGAGRHATAGAPPVAVAE